MRPGSVTLLAAAVLVVLVAPLALSVVGLIRNHRHASPPESAGWDWRLTLGSMLLSTVAYNLVFFVQELFLVLPKALTPGLHPTLFHNNHTWTGEHPRLVTGIQVQPRTRPISLWPALVALVAVLLIFQLVLRPGVAF
jgi:hypothetical protein